MLTKVAHHQVQVTYLEYFPLVHDLLFVGGDIRQVEELGAEDFHSEARVHLQVVEGLLIPLDADYEA